MKQHISDFQYISKENENGLNKTTAQ